MSTVLVFHYSIIIDLNIDTSTTYIYRLEFPPLLLSDAAKREEVYPRIFRNSLLSNNVYMVKCLLYYVTPNQPKHA